MNIYTPYTYLIGWSKHNRWYYGVRYAKNCNPVDLWTKYFTSSEKVKDFRKEYGEPDIKQIRKTFSDAKQAKNWEDRVLVRLKVHIKEQWLNKSCNTWRGIINEIPWNKGIKRPDISLLMKEMRIARPDWGTVKGYTNDYRKQNGLNIIIGKPKGSKDCQETKTKKSNARKGKLTVRDEEGNCFLVNTDDERYLSGKLKSVMLGVALGNKHSDETKCKLKMLAQNRPVFFCEICNRKIKGKMNWDRHLLSKKHLSQLD